MRGGKSVDTVLALYYNEIKFQVRAKGLIILQNFTLIADRKFRHLFIKYFIPYLIIITIFILASSYSYQVAWQEIETHIENQQEDYLLQSKTYLDHIFAYIQETAIKLLSEPSITSFSQLKKDYVKDNYFSTVSLLQDVKDIVIDFSYIDHYYILYNNSEKVVINGSSITSFDLFYGKQFTYDHLSAENFYNLVFDSIYLGGKYFPSAPTTQIGKHKDAFIIIQTISFDYRGPSAVIVFVMNTREIEKYMTKEQNLHYIFSMEDENQGEIASFRNFNNKTDKDIYSTHQLSSEIAPLTYKLKVEKSNAYMRLNRLKIINTWIYCFLFLTNFIISFYFAKKYSKPVVKLIHDNDELNLKVLQQKLVFKQSFLEKWLYGNYETKEDLIQMANCVNDSILNHIYCVVLIDFDPSNWFNDTIVKSTNRDFSIVSMKELLVEHCQYELICDISPNRLAVIYVSSKTSFQDIQDEITKDILHLKKELDNLLFTNTLFSVGTVEEDIIHVSRSFNNARDTLIKATHTPYSSERLFYYELAHKEEGLYYYPCEIESRLINCVHAGRIEDVKKLLHDIFQENIINKNLSSGMIDAFVHELCGTYIKILHKLDTVVQEDTNEGIGITKKLASMDAIHQLQFLQKALLDLCSNIKSEKNNNYTKLMTDMMAYVNENYSQHDMSLALLASKFKFTEVYVSQLFKNYYNISFLTYLQNLRMEKTRELLLSTQLPVKDIMSLVGYSSINTFTRAFKRINGVTATEYRKKNKNQ